MPATPGPRAKSSSLLPPAPPQAPTVESILTALSEPRLPDLCRIAGCDVRGVTRGRASLSRKLAERIELPPLLRELGRDELRASCRRHGLDATSPARAELQAGLLAAAGLDPRASLSPSPVAPSGALPQKGQVVHARRRQWMVEDVVLGASGESPLVRLVCLDDDDPGRALEVLWDLELGARVVAPETSGLGEGLHLDPPARFGAYLHAIKWSAVSAADATRF